MTVTIFQLAEHVLGRTPENGEDFALAGLEIIGGCGLCHATIDAARAYPSTVGFWLCGSCVGDRGWQDVIQAAHDLYGSLTAIRRIRRDANRARETAR